jgi:hypothetical protein
VPFNERVNAINTRSFKRSVHAKPRKFLISTRRNLSGPGFKADGTIVLHQRGVIAAVRPRQSGAINTGCVH